MTFSSRISIFTLFHLVLLSYLFSATAVVHAEKNENRTITLKHVEVEEERVLNALVESVHQATISAQTSGRVVKINVDVDDTVNKGDILVQFRNKKQKAALNVAKAAFDEAQSEFNRVQDIYNKKLVAKSILDKATSRFKSSKARLAQATEAFEDTMVRAPYSGIVVKRHIQVGELANPGRKLMTGLSLEKLRASISLPQDLVNIVRDRKKATAILKDGRRLLATKITISPFADPQSHTFNMRADLPKGDYAIYPGMFIKLAIVSGTKQSLLVPESAIARRSEVNAVYVINKNDKLIFRQVRVGAYQPASKSYEILAGLEAGERIMLDPIAAAAQLKLQE